MFTINLQKRNTALRNKLTYKLAEAIHAVIQKPFDMDFATCDDLYWYAIDSADGLVQITPTPGATDSGHADAIRRAVDPLFRERGFVSPESALSCEMFTTLNFFHVVSEPVETAAAARTGGY